MQHCSPRVVFPRCLNNWVITFLSLPVSLNWAHFLTPGKTFLIVKWHVGEA